MAKKRATIRDLEKRLDRISTAFLVGAAILEPYIDMGQPRDAQSSSAAQVAPAQPISRCDPTNYAAFPPSERYGNIYFPYHIEQTQSIGSHLRYRVVNADGEIVVPDVSWSEATEFAQWFNNGERPPAVDIIVARS